MEVANTIASNVREVESWDWKWLVMVLTFGFLIWIPPAIFGWTVAGTFGFPMGQ